MRGVRFRMFKYIVLALCFHGAFDGRLRSPHHLCFHVAGCHIPGFSSQCEIVEASRPVRCLTMFLHLTELRFLVASAKLEVFLTQKRKKEKRLRQPTCSWT